MSKVVKSYRIEEDADAVVGAAAGRVGESHSAFVRRAALDRAVRIIKDEGDNGPRKADHS